MDQIKGVFFYLITDHIKLEPSPNPREEMEEKKERKLGTTKFSCSYDKSLNSLSIHSENQFQTKT